MIKSINDTTTIVEENMVMLVMTEENAIKLLHFANFGEDTMEAVYDAYKGNRQDLDLKMDNLADLKEQLGVTGKKVSNLTVV